MVLHSSATFLYANTCAFKCLREKFSDRIELQAIKPDDFNSWFIFHLLNKQNKKRNFQTTQRLLYI